MTSNQNPSNLDAIGVDGCREGWIAVFRSEGVLGHFIYPTFGELMTAASNNVKVAVDIPIGLPFRDIPSRACDLAARKLLKKRRSSVFSPPSRQATQQQYSAVARMLNKAEVGKSLSEQALGIARKIAEVDQWLNANPGASDRVLEIHPEVCFWSLNGKCSMAHPKKSAAGRDERLQLLMRWEPEATALLRRVQAQHRRSQVQPDDVLDALAAYVTISAPSESLRHLPEQPEWDAAGLPMQMLYREC
jgi:predicted RNase H-like nuclease